jgi:hypothetical protein
MKAYCKLRTVLVIHDQDNVKGTNIFVLPDIG